LRVLETENGPVTSQSDLSHYVTDFYERLYSSKVHVFGTQEAQEGCWDNVPVRVASETNVCLTKSLMLEEILKAIHALPKGKAPGHDGIPMEFFQECVNEVAPTLLKAFTTMLDMGEASTSINKGLITLIPKSGDHSKFGNWRPITLLGSVYKILAKALAGRIQTFLPDIIRAN